MGIEPLATSPAGVLLALIRLAGPEGRSSTELRLGCRCVAGQEALLADLEAAGLVRSKPAMFAFAGRLYIAVQPS
jgi:hypothetical protein